MKMPHVQFISARKAARIAAKGLLALLVGCDVAPRQNENREATPIQGDALAPDSRIEESRIDRHNAEERNNSRKTHR